MSATRTSSSLLQTPLFQSVAYLFLFIFAALLIISAIYFALSYMADTSSELDELLAVKEDKEATSRIFSIVAAVSVVGLVFGGTVLSDGDGSGGAGAVNYGNILNYNPPLPVFYVGAPSPPSHSEHPHTPEFTFEDGKAYSGDDVIPMYQNLPRNAIINCDLEVEGKFEECTVTVADEKVHLNNSIDPILKDKDRRIARCCTDKSKNTVMFTTMAKNPQWENCPDITMEDCFDKDCDLHARTKAVRNRVYLLLFNSQSKGCKVETSAKEGVRTFPHIIRVKGEPDSIRNEIHLMCPEGFDWEDDEAGLYKGTLTSPHLKLATWITEHTDPPQLELVSNFNGYKDGSDFGSLKSFLETMMSTAQ